MTLGDLLDLVRAYIAEPIASYWSEAELTNYINYGLNDFCNRTQILEDIRTWSSVDNQEDYTLPTGWCAIKKLYQVKGNSQYLLSPQSVNEYLDSTINTVSSTAESYNIWTDKIRLKPRINADADVGALSAVLATAATSAGLLTNSVFPRMGRVLIGSEVIGFTAKSGTSGLIGLQRGLEGTTDTSHALSSIVYERDLFVYFNKLDATMTSTASTPAIPTQFHDALAFYAASIAKQKSKDWDLANNFKAQYEQRVELGVDYVKHKWRERINPTYNPSYADL